MAKTLEQLGMEAVVATVLGHVESALVERLLWEDEQLLTGKTRDRVQELIWEVIYDQGEAVEDYVRDALGGS